MDGIYILAYGLSKNIIFEQKKSKLQNKRHFVEIETQNMQNLLKMQ